MICLHTCIQQQVQCHSFVKFAKMQPAAERLSGPASPSCSFRVKFSQTLDFLLQTSHSNTLASPPRFFPQVNVINSAVCSVDWPSSSQSECLSALPTFAQSLTFSLPLSRSVSLSTHKHTSVPPFAFLLLCLSWRLFAGFFSLLLFC